MVASDGTQDYTFTRDNIWDNYSDESWMGLADAAAGDVTTILGNVFADPYDVRDIEVKSVDVDAAFSNTRRHGGITDANVARAIRWGANAVDVTYYHTGSAEPQTMHATLDVPQGTDLSGYLIVMPAAEWADYSSDYSLGRHHHRSAHTGRDQGDRRRPADQRRRGRRLPPGLLGGRGQLLRSRSRRRSRRCTATGCSRAASRRRPPR